MDSDGCLLPLERFSGVLRSLGPAVARCVALEEVSMPVRSALALAFPKAKYVGVQLLVGNGVYVSVGNFLQHGPTTATLLQYERSLTGRAVAQCNAVSASFKKDGTALADVAYAAEMFGASALTAIPLVVANGPEPWKPLDNLISSIETPNNTSDVLESCAEVARGGQVIGTISVGVDAADIDQDTAFRHLKNVAMLAVSVAPHGIGEGMRLINDVASLVGLTLPGRAYEYVPGVGHKELDMASGSWRYNGGAPYVASASSTASMPSEEDIEAELQYSDLDEEYIRELQDDDASDDEELGSSVGTACHTDDLSDFDDFDGAPPCPLINLHERLADPSEPAVDAQAARGEAAAAGAGAGIPGAQCQASAVAAACAGGVVAGGLEGGSSSSPAPDCKQGHSKAGSFIASGSSSGVMCAAEAAQLAVLAPAMHWLTLTFASRMLEHRFSLRSKHLLRWVLALLFAPFVCRSVSSWAPTGGAVGPFVPLLGFLFGHVAMACTWAQQRQFRSVALAEYITALTTLAAYKTFPAAEALGLGGSLPALAALWRTCRVFVTLMLPLSMARLTMQLPLLLLSAMCCGPIAAAASLSSGNYVEAAAAVGKAALPCLVVPLGLAYFREFVCRRLFLQELRAAASTGGPATLVGHT